MDPEQTPIWTPPEKLDPNVQRMAWLLFQEEFKAHLAGHYTPTYKGQELAPFDVKSVYLNALKTAKAVRGFEIDAGSA